MINSKSKHLKCAYRWLFLENWRTTRHFVFSNLHTFTIRLSYINKLLLIIKKNVSGISTGRVKDLCLRIPPLQQYFHRKISISVTSYLPTLFLCNPFFISNETDLYLTLVWVHAEYIQLFIKWSTANKYLLNNLNSFVQ